MEKAPTVLPIVPINVNEKLGLKNRDLNRCFGAKLAVRVVIDTSRVSVDIKQTAKKNGYH